MDGKSCIVCRTPVTLGTKGTALRHECGHRTHTSCFKVAQDVNYAQCHHCAGQLDYHAPLLPAVEPGSQSGRDYIEHPLPAPTALKAGLQKVASLVNKKTVDPATLIAQGRDVYPVDRLIREGFGLQRLLEHQIDMGTLLDRGYRWPDLALFKDLASPVRRKKALLALRLSSHDLIGALQPHLADMEFGAKDMIDLLGMRFPMPGWTARDLVSLGWKAPDLLAAGLTYIEDYAALDPDDADETALGVTPEFLARLPAQTQAQVPVPEPVSAPMQVATFTVQLTPAPVSMPAPVSIQARPPAVRHHGLRK